jgi:hypothetical protein
MKHFFSLRAEALRWVGLLWLGLWLVVAGPASAAPAQDPPGAHATPSLAGALNPDGTLRASAQGSFDARQFEMHTGPDGRPTFSPARAAATGNEGWHPGFGVPGTNGSVNAVLQAGTDIYIGGDFTVVDGITAYEVAKWDGTRWSSLGTGAANGTLGGYVLSLAMSGNNLYVGGFFTKAGALTANNIARWDGTSWSNMGGGVSANYRENAYVNALAVLGTTVYAGGKFLYAGSGANTVSTNQLARWDGTRWASVGTGTNNGVTGYLATVYALALTPTSLYVGGYFSKAGTVTANNIARWDGTSWSSLGNGTANGVGSTVNAIVASGTSVYVGGTFTSAGTLAANYIARWNGTAWSSLGTGAANGVSGRVQSLVMLGTSLYVGGYFAAAGGAPASSIAKWDGTAWSSPGVGVANDIGLSTVRGLAVLGTSLYASGDFSRQSGAISNYVAKLDGATWSRLGTNPGNGVGSTSAGSPVDYISTILVAGTDVYIGGQFSLAGNVPANNIAKWDGTAWSSLGTGPTNGVNAPVYALAMLGSRLYVGGEFTQAGNVPIRHMAQWDGTTWSALGVGLTPGLSTYVIALAASGSDLYVAGGFSQAGGIPANNIAKWNGSTWSSLGTGTANGIGNGVNALAMVGSDLYAAGTFNSAGGMPAGYIARWDGTAWNTLGTGATNGVNSYVYALAVVGSKLYAGGSFYKAGGADIKNLAQWDGASWSAVGGGVNDRVISLAAAGSNLYVGGQFYQVGGQFTPYIAKWDGAAWSGLGTGLGFAANAVAVGPGDNVNVGGAFVNVYGDDTQIVYHFGIYNETPAPVLTAIAPGSGSVGTTLTLTGTNLAGATTVSFNGTPTTAITNNTGTSLTVTVPAGTTSGPVVVVTPGGVSNSLPFVVLTDLVVSTTTPIAPGTYNSITVTGTGNGTLAGGVVVTGFVLVQPGGILTTDCQPLTGAGSFTLAAGATLGICDPLGIVATGPTGAVQLAGTRSFSTDASYVYNGTVEQVTGSGLPGQVRNLTTVNPRRVTLSQGVAIAQILTINSQGGLLQPSAAASVTLLSDAVAGTALIVGGSPMGNTTTVQRAIDGSTNPGLGYRHFASPAYGTATTINSLATTDFTPVVNSLYNTQGTSVRPFPTVYLYEETRLGDASVPGSGFDKGWVSPNSLSEILFNGSTGYALQLPATAKLSVTGSVLTGGVGFTFSRTGSDPDAGWHLLGNPYPSPLDWSRVQASDRVGFDAAIYVFESTGPYSGQYRSYANGIGGNPIIPLGQAFFARVSTGQQEGSIFFRNSQRVTTFEATPVKRLAADPRPQLALSLRSATAADVTYLYQEAGATAGPDAAYDAVKLLNTNGLNLSQLAAASQLAINGLPVLTAATTVPLAVGVPAAGTYTLAATTLTNLPAGLEAYLFDAQTGQLTQLRAGTSYAFSVTRTEAQALLTSRFRLQFSPQTPLATAPSLLPAEVVVYPNPAHGSFMVAVPAVAGASQVQAELRSALGQVVHTQAAALPAAGARLTVLTEGLATGVYVLRLTAGASVITKRVVVN